MSSYLRGLTVEEEVGCNVVSHEIQRVVYPILRGCNARSVYHRSILFASDLNSLSEMRIPTEERVN